MADSDYVPTTWVDGVTPITAAQLNRLETGVELANDRLDIVEGAGGGGGGSYTDEQVRDVIGAAVQAGTRMTVTVNDVADTITVATTATQVTVDGVAQGTYDVSTTAVTPADIGAQPADSDLTAIAALTPTNDDVLQRKAGAWTNRTIAQLKSDLGIAADIAATDATAVHKTGAETVAGIKTFSSAPVVPDASFAEAKVINLVSDLAGKQPLDSDLTDVAALTPTNDDVLQRKSGAWTNRTMVQLRTDLGLATTYQPLDSDLTAIAALDATTAGAMATDGSGWIRKTYAQLKTALGLVKADVGLGSVDNTSDATKLARAAGIALILGS